MKAYIIQSRKKIAPFYERAEDILVGNEKLSVLQAKALTSLALEPNFIHELTEISDDNEYVVFGDELYFETELLKQFIEESRRKQCQTVCSVKTGVFTIRTLTGLQNVKKNNGSVEYILFYYPPRRFRNNLVIPIVLNLDNSLENIRLPLHMCGSGRYCISVSEKPIIQLDHWVNIWSANIASILASVSRRQKSKIRLFPFFLKAFSFNKWKIASLLNKIGENCDIHPTAYIEASTIGNNVIIGAGAIVRESIVGDNSVIGNAVTIEFSVVGRNCTILNGHILYSVLYSGVFSVTHMLSTSLVGRDCFIGSGVILTDFRLDGKPVMVEKEGKKISSGNLFLGCCLGHNVYLGGGCVIAPGRADENRWV